LPVAVNCWVVPAALEGLAGVTVMEVSVGEDCVAAMLSDAELELEKEVPVEVLPDIETRYGVVTETEIEEGIKNVIRRVVPTMVVTAVAVV
jgi:hypothetical protein